MRRRFADPVFGFTLVELMVVILIIAVLLSILLPTLWKVHRRAMGLAARIAYVDDENPNLCIADGAGSKRIRLVGFGDGPKYDMGDFFNTAILWSPDGTRIAAPCQTRTEILVMDVATGKWKTHLLSRGTGFTGWVANDRITAIESSSSLTVLDSDLGKLLGTIRLPFDGSSNGIALSRAPQTCRRGQYITSYGNSNGAAKGIALLKKDFSLGKCIWEEPAGSLNTNCQPRVDPFGDWVAWTVSSSAIAVKRIEAPSSEPPEILKTQFKSIIFCDWTDDAKLLCNALITPASGNNFRDLRGLVILDLTGKLCRDLQIKCKRATTASWRRFEH